MKKNQFIKAAICVMLLACMAVVAVPANAQSVPQDVAPAAAEYGARINDTEWIYRDNNGVLEKRLWSRTYAMWMTGWIKA